MKGERKDKRIIKNRKQPFSSVKKNSKARLGKCNKNKVKTKNEDFF